MNFPKSSSQIQPVLVLVLVANANTNSAHTALRRVAADPRADFELSIRITERRIRGVVP